MFKSVIDTWSAFAFQSWAPSYFGAQSSGIAQQGDFISSCFDGESRSLRYMLYIPSTYSGQPSPLVVMLHGCGQDAGDFARGTDMNRLAEQLRCLILYPEQSSSVHWNRCWNWYDALHHQRDEGEPALIAGVTRKIMDEYAIDADRVSVAGMSSGAAMAVILGRTYPDLFSAVGSHSGLPHGCATDSAGALAAMRDGAAPAPTANAGVQGGVRMIAFHGDRDMTVHQKNSACVIQQSIDSHAAWTPGRDDALSKEEETGHVRHRGFTRHTYRTDSGAIVAEHWTVHGTGHAWSGGNLHGRYADQNGPDASQEMLRFFLAG